MYLRKYFLYKTKRKQLKKIDTWGFVPANFSVEY